MKNNDPDQVRQDHYEEWVMSDPCEKGEVGEYSAFCAGWEAAMKAKPDHAYQDGYNQGLAAGDKPHDR